MLTQSPLAMFAFAFSITAPIFLMVLLGLALKRCQMIDEAFIATASKLVYSIGLPTLLFINSASADLTNLTDVRLLISISAMTLIVFLLSQLTARWHIRQASDQGVFVQGAFRGNLVITGLAFCANAYGERGLAIAALPVATTVIIYNILSVYALHKNLPDNKNNSFKKTIVGVLRNPLILAILAGLFMNIGGVPLPNLLRDSGNYLGQMVLPLALICIGGALNLKELRNFDHLALIASIWKLIISPAIACSIGLLMGVRGEYLVVLFLLAASPTATVSFVMVQAIGGNARLAANIIVQTTLLSMLTATLGLWILQTMGWAQ